MLSEVIEFNNRYGLLDGCGSVIVGLSGGADSVALFHVLRELRSRYGFSIIAVHVHHGIRGKKPTGIWILQKFMPPVRSGTAGIFL